MNPDTISVQLHGKSMKFSRHQSQIQGAFISSMNQCYMISVVSHVNDTTAEVETLNL